MHVSTRLDRTVQISSDVHLPQSLGPLFIYTGHRKIGSGITTPTSSCAPRSSPQPYSALSVLQSSRRLAPMPQRLPNFSPSWLSCPRVL